MRRALVDMQPDRFEDLIALVALYRPGPMANIPTYCARKLGRETGRVHPPRVEADPRGDLRHHHLPGAGACRSPRTSPATTLAEADLLRRAMGKKIKAEMDAQRGRFLNGATERGIDQRRPPTTIFDACAKFADYGFNKSHSAPYALHHLPDRLDEGELPGRVPGRLADAGNREHRQDRRVPARGAPTRHRRRAAVGQSLGRRIRRR